MKSDICRIDDSEQSGGEFYSCGNCTCDIKKLFTNSLLEVIQETSKLKILQFVGKKKTGKVLRALTVALALTSCTKVNICSRIPIIIMGPTKVRISANFLCRKCVKGDTLINLVTSFTQCVYVTLPALLSGRPAVTCVRKFKSGSTRASARVHESL